MGISDLEGEKLELEVGILKAGKKHRTLRLIVSVVGLVLAAVVAVSGYLWEACDAREQEERARLDRLVAGIDIYGDTQGAATSVLQLTYERQRSEHALDDYEPALRAVCQGAREEVSRLEQKLRIGGRVQTAHALKRMRAIGSQLDAMRLCGPVVVDDPPNLGRDVSTSPAPWICTITAANPAGGGIACDLRYPTPLGITCAPGVLGDGDQLWVLVQDKDRLWIQPGPLESSDGAYRAEAWPGTPDAGCERRYAFEVRRVPQALEAQIAACQKAFMPLPVSPGDAAAGLCPVPLQSVRLVGSLGPCKRRC